MSDGAGVLTALGQVTAALVSMGVEGRRKRQARRMIRDLVGELRDVERRDAERRRAAVEAVRRQMARGDAGDATAAQRGQAGRNPLDERFF